MGEYIKLENFEDLKKIIEEIKTEEGYLVSKREYEFLQSMKKYLRESAGLEPLLIITLDEKTNKIEEYSRFSLKGANFNLVAYMEKDFEKSHNIGKVQSLIGEAIVKEIIFETEDEALMNEKESSIKPPIKKANLIIPLVVRSEI